MSTKRKRAVLSIKDEQIIISCQDKGEKGTNLAQELGISKQQISVIRKNKDKILKNVLFAVIPFVYISFSLIFIFLIIWTLDYPDYLPRSRQVWIIEAQLYTENRTANVRMSRTVLTDLQTQCCTFWFFLASQLIPIAIVATILCSTFQLGLSLWPRELDKPPSWRRRRQLLHSSETLPLESS